MNAGTWSALFSAVAAIGAVAVAVIMALQHYSERGERGFVTRARSWTIKTRAAMFRSEEREQFIKEEELEYAIWADERNLLRLLSDKPGSYKIRLP